MSWRHLGRMMKPFSYEVNEGSMEVDQEGPTLIKQVRC